MAVLSPMRHLTIYSLLAVAVIALATRTARAAAVQVGDRLPTVSVSDWQGDAVDVTAAPSQVMVIDFWASWCQPCRAALPALNEIARRHAAAGLQVVAINIDKAQAPADAFIGKFVPALAMTLRRDASGAALARFGAAGMPALYVVDRRGVVRLVEAGFTADKLGDVEALLVNLLDTSEAP